MTDQIGGRGLCECGIRYNFQRRNGHQRGRGVLSHSIREREVGNNDQHFVSHFLKCKPNILAVADLSHSSKTWKRAWRSSFPRLGPVLMRATSQRFLHVCNPLFESLCSSPSLSSRPPDRALGDPPSPLQYSSTGLCKIMAFGSHIKSNLHQPLMPE